MLSQLVEGQTGLHVAISLGAPEFLQIGELFCIGTLLTLLPAIASFANPIEAGLRN